LEDPGALERLTARMEMLERRVLSLEALQQPAPAAPIAQPTTSATETLSQTDGLFSVLGKAMLGIAGAYLLRAVAESGSLPLLLLAVIAIVYGLPSGRASCRER